MKNQFFYTKTIGEVTALDSFNVNKVIRTVTIDEGKRLLVLLDDIHERSQDVPDIHPKTNAIKGYKRQRDVFQSEIYLEGDDINRFYNATSIIP